MNKKHSAFKAALCFAAIAAIGVRASAQSGITIMAKPGATYDMRAADIARCKAVVSKAPNYDLPWSNVTLVANPIGGGLPAVAGVLVANILITAVSENNARNNGQALCMYNLGYRALPLTTAEEDAYSPLWGAQRFAWERRFFAGNLRARLAPLFAMRVPRLPPYQNESMAIGGIKLSDFSLTAQRIHENDTVLTGTATRIHTAVLVTPIQTQTGPIRIAAAAGTVFHQVDYRVPLEPLLRQDGATWCGPVQQFANGNVAKDLFCFTGRDYGYVVFRPSGHVWMAGPYTDGLTLPVYDQPIRMKERAQDDLGPMDLGIKVIKVYRHSLVLFATLTYHKETTPLWCRQLSYNAKGVTTLPLWDWRLSLTRVGSDTVTAALTHDGDGHDWRAGSPYPFHIDPHQKCSLESK